MNINNILSNNQAAALCGLCVVVGGALVFNKLSHLAEYTLNKTFGDYKNPEKTRDGRIIVSMPYGKDYYYTQNIILGVLVAAISAKAVQILVSNCPKYIASPLLVSSVAVPILWSLFNMLLRYDSCHEGRWVEISDAEVNKHGINKDQVKTTMWGKRVYCGFGSAPEYFPGSCTESDYY